LSESDVEDMERQEMRTVRISTTTWKRKRKRKRHG
jgi:hypothetical protein